ncbi:hypothetical protein C8J57DRAFT_1465938 [Mycena rebaudengoi]|nr:hypothetical protein C8J57DRAFT_1465938 [Mycena rebaudengoi]
MRDFLACFFLWAFSFFFFSPFSEVRNIPCIFRPIGSRNAINQHMDAPDLQPPPTRTRLTTHQQPQTPHARKLLSANPRETPRVVPPQFYWTPLGPTHGILLHPALLSSQWPRLPPARAPTPAYPQSPARADIYKAIRVDQARSDARSAKTLSATYKTRERITARAAWWRRWEGRTGRWCAGTRCCANWWGTSEDSDGAGDRAAEDGGPRDDVLAKTLAVLPAHVAWDVVVSSLLDTSSRKLLRPDAPRKMTSSWPTFDNENPRFTGHTESLWTYSLSSLLPSTNLSSSSFCTKPEVHLEPASNEVWDYETPCTYLTQSERALMDKLSIHPPARDYEWWVQLVFDSSPSPLEKHNDVPHANVMLHDFETTLEDYAAAFYWSLTYLRNSPTSQKIEVTGSKLVSQLQLDTLPVVAGTIFSTVLLLLSPILVGFSPTADKRKENIEFDTLGVLETVWLVGSGSAVTAVEIPSTKHLRKAGMSVKTAECNRRGEEQGPRRMTSSA